MEQAKESLTAHLTLLSQAVGTLTEALQAPLTPILFVMRRSSVLNEIH